MDGNNRHTRFDGYFDSIFKDSNILTPEQYELAAQNFNHNFARFLPQDKNSKILDIGCGCGHFLYFLKKNGYANFHGIDISPQQVEYCQKNIAEHVEVFDSFEFLKDKKDQYDCISLIAVLEHIPKDRVREFLELVYGALKKGGVFLVDVPNMNNPFSINLRYRDFTHEIGLTEISLKQVLWDAGFRDIQMAAELICVRSFKNWARAVMVEMLWKFLRFLYYIQDFAVPRIMSAGLIGAAKK